MKTVIQGQVTGKDGIGIPNLVVELWGIDEQGNLSGTKPSLRSITRSGGHFRLDMQRLPSDMELPATSVILFRYSTGLEVGRIAVAPAAIEGQAIRYEDPKLTAPTFLEIWPRPYSPVKLIPEGVKDKLKKSLHEELVLESVPQIGYFATYAYLWPSPLGTEESTEGQEEEPLRQPFLLGVQVLHRQEWHLLGHARGELLHSLPLAPGEETTIEVLTWDRNVYKREEEITSDLERQIEKNRQVKDSREVLREIEENTKWNVEGGVGVNLFKIVKIGIEGGYEAQTRELNRTTLSTIVETTDRASTKIHSQRKTLVSSTREFGREEKVTRKISNTNRGHTVTFHFYEVLSNYHLETSLVSVRPCIFIKKSPPIRLLEDVRGEGAQAVHNKVLETMHWLHDNSSLISKGLLDCSYFKAFELLSDLLPLVSYPPDLTGIDLDYHLDQAVRNLISVTEAIYEATEEPEDLVSDQYSRWQYRRNWMGEFPSLPAVPWIFELILEASDSLKNSIEKKDQDGKSMLTKAVQKFIRMWEAKYLTLHYRHRDLIENGRPDLFYSHVEKLQVMYWKAEEELWPYYTLGESEEERHQWGKNMAEVLRLIRHIKDNYLHYFQLIWAAKDPGQRLLEASNVVLPGSGDVRLAEAIEPDLLGFYADYAIFPYTRVEEGSDLAQLVQAFLNLEEAPRESEVVLPTNGIVVEPQLGEFTACEPFIERHRVYDLRLKELEADKAQLENERRRKKIEICELENPECCPSPKSGFFTRLACWLRRRRRG